MNSEAAKESETSRKEAVGSNRDSRQDSRHSGVGTSEASASASLPSPQPAERHDNSRAEAPLSINGAASSGTRTLPSRHDIAQEIAPARRRCNWPRHTQHAPWHGQQYYPGAPPGFENPQHPAASPRLNHQAQAFRPSQPNWQQQELLNQRPHAGLAGERPSRSGQNTRNRSSANTARQVAGLQRGEPHPAGRGMNMPQKSKPKPGKLQDKLVGTNGPEAPSNQTQTEFPSCGVCFGDLKIVSVGPCNHKEVCAICTLRMRRFYKRQQCSLCRGEAKEIVLSSWRPEGVADWKDLSQDLSKLWIQPAWEKGVYVDNDSGKGLDLAGPLSSVLQAQTGKMCMICDVEGSKLFPSNKSLLRHLEMEHGKFLCEICLKLDKQFTRELEPYSKEELGKHMKMHPKCPHCPTQHFSQTETFQHVMDHHFVCRVCLEAQQGSSFSALAALQEHLRANHFTCRHPVCREACVAYASLQQYRRHMSQEHGEGLERRRHGYVLELTPPANTLPTGPSARPSSQQTRAPRSGHLISQAQLQHLREALGRIQRTWLEAERIGAENRGEESAQSAAGIRGFLHDLEGRVEAFQRSIHSRFTMTDDNANVSADLASMMDVMLNMYSNAVDRLGVPTASGRGTGRAAANGGLHALQLSMLSTAAQLRELTQRVHQVSQLAEPIQTERTADAFPALDTVNQQGQARDVATNDRAPASLPQLVSVVRRCPCGRRTDRPVVPEGSSLAPLSCNDTCHRAQRRDQLANAFDISDPNHHIPVADRSRTVVHSPQILHFAYHNLEWIKRIEKTLMAFVSSNERQQNLQPMRKPLREAVHEMAQAFALTTQSYGQEPTRYIRLIKGGNEAVPSNLLSKEIAGKSLEEITDALAGSNGFLLHLYDVSDRADLGLLFQRWRGEVHFDEADMPQGRVTANFNTEAQLKEALTAFGGGLRGEFRIDRPATLRKSLRSPRVHLRRGCSSLNNISAYPSGHLGGGGVRPRRPQHQW